MSQYVFNDIYGNESARDKYQSDREYGYFNTLLKIHNKYYQDNQMHNYIFSPRRTRIKNRPNQREGLNPLIKNLQSRHQRQTNAFTYYNVQKLNNITFRISKKNKISISQHVNLKSTLNKSPQDRHTTNSSNHNNRNIIQDAKYLQSALSIESSRSRRSPKNNKQKQRQRQRYKVSDFNLNEQDKAHRLKYLTVSKQFRNLSHQYYTKY